MLIGAKESIEEKAELDFHVLKRAIGDCLNGKHEPLFKPKTVAMSKEENYNKFDDLLKTFEKKKGGG